MISENEFELIFNIESNKKIFFGDLSLKLPIDFKKDNFTSLEKLFRDVKGEPYSITVIEKILDEIDLITITEQFESVKANVIEELISDKINLIFQIEDTEKLFVEKLIFLEIILQTKT